MIIVTSKQQQIYLMYWLPITVRLSGSAVSSPNCSPKT